MKMTELLCERDRVLVEIEITDHRRRIGRKRDHNRDRLRDRMLDGVFDGAEEVGAVARGQLADGDAGDDEAEGVDRVRRIWHQHHVARCGDGLRHVGKAFLAPERRHDLGLGIELHAEAAFVVGGLGAAQARYALRRRIAVRARLVDRLNQLVDDVLRRRHVGIAHAEVDDVGAARPRRRLQPVDLGEDIGRKALDPVKIFAQSLTLSRAF